MHLLLYFWFRGLEECNEVIEVISVYLLSTIFHLGVRLRKTHSNRMINKKNVIQYKVLMLVINPRINNLKSMKNKINKKHQILLQNEFSLHIYKLGSSNDFHKKVL